MRLSKPIHSWKGCGCQIYSERVVYTTYTHANTLLTWMHLRLLFGFLLRLPLLLARSVMISHNRNQER